jgi:dolichol-phosphate mannosyltransferase
MSFVSSCHHARNLGQSAAIRTGVTAATAQSVVVLDGDGQNDPKDILKMFGHLATIPNLKMVIGERRNRKDTWSRRMSSRVANSIRSHFLCDGVCDTGCGLKAFFRDDFLELPAFDLLHRFLPALMQRQGGRVCSVPVNHRPRLHGKSKYGIRNRLWVGITDMLGVAWLQKRSLT